MSTYTFDVSRLRRGHSFGNSQVYCALDAKSDLFEELNTHRGGLRDSITQYHFLLGWRVSVATSSGEAFEPTKTTFTEAHQETELRLRDAKVTKRFFVPFENNHLRSAHFLLTAKGNRPARVRCLLLLPDGATATRAERNGHAHVAIAYPNGFGAVVWGSGALTSLETKINADKRVEVSAEFSWDAAIGDVFGLSFAVSPHGNAGNAMIEPFAPDATSAASHLRRLHSIERETALNIDRYLQTARLWTPDALVNRGALWAKINQLRDYQEYAAGVGFSNNPPSDVLVARDTFWFLVATNYYAQEWSRRLLETWFRLGLEPNGKWIEYMMPSGKPMFRDDYGLNINDNTPLMLIVSHHYYAITGDRGFLNYAYAPLLATANYILAQRDAGGSTLNPHRLVWCSATETFTRGLVSWRNCFNNGQISGAVTEINALCVEALRCAADLAKHLGDEPNAKRFADATEDLRRAINAHLKSATPNNPHYLQNITPSGERNDLLTADLLFPVLCGVPEADASQAILKEIFGPKFWVTSPTGAAGMRTVAPDQKGAALKADPGNYGLTGGVWPNLALWAGRAAALVGRTDLLVQGLRATMLLSDREDFDRCNVTPGEFPEYYNGDDLVQRGNNRSTFIHGSYQWAALEGVMGIRPLADGLSVNPILPAGWKWAAVQNLPHRGFPLTIFALAEERTLYTTMRVASDWKQVIVPLAPQEQHRLESDNGAMWMIVPEGSGFALLAASDVATRARLVHRDANRVVAEVKIDAGAVVRTSLRS